MTPLPLMMNIDNTFCMTYICILTCAYYNNLHSCIIFCIVQGVPKETIQKKLKSVDPFDPYFYAWFLNYDDSLSVRSVADNVYSECLDQPEFVQEFLQHVVPEAAKSEDGRFLSWGFNSVHIISQPIALINKTVLSSEHGILICPIHTPIFNSTQQ